MVQNTSCGTGACYRTGQRTCVNGSTQNSCSPGSPTSDANCNNVDNDCDGATDEHFVSTGTSCGVGGCYRTGFTYCSSGSVGNTCSPGSPTTEICDGTPSGGLRAHWKFAGNANDSSGNGVHGTLLNGAAIVNDGTRGQVLQLDGSNDRMLAGTPEALQIETDLTIAMWVRPTNLNRRVNPYGKAYGGEGTITLEPSGYLNFYYGVSGNNASPYQGFTSGGPISTNTWTHIAIIRDTNDNKLRWYINGNLSREGNMAYPVAKKSSRNAYIGNEYVYYFPGRIDDVAVYNVALTTEQLRTLRDTPPNGNIAGGSGATDNDCDGSSEEQNAANCNRYHKDSDEDGYGVTNDWKCLCAPSGDYTASPNRVGDCDDGNSGANPGQTEKCSTTYDDDCDGSTNENGAAGCVTYYRDNDNDGYGQTSNSQCRCTPGDPYDTTSYGDCNDSVPSIHPLASETACNGVDNDCDGATDENYSPVNTSCGTGQCARTGQTWCYLGNVYDLCSPGSPSSDANCNNVDNDCDGATDEHYVPVGTSCGVGQCYRTGATYCSNGSVGNTCSPGPAGTETCDGVGKDLVGFWNFQGLRANDYSKSDANGSFVNGAYATPTSRGNALRLDGSNDYVNMGNHSALRVTGAQTIAFWIYATNSNRRTNPYGKAYGGEGTITFETNRTFSYYYGRCGGNCSPYQGFNAGYAISLNRWTHIAFVRDPSTMKLHFYVNGVLRGTAKMSWSSAVASSNSATIGDNYVYTVPGYMDDVALFKRALSTSEVVALKNAAPDTILDPATGANDEDCDGGSDEEGASGCTWFHKDNDKDGWGLAGTANRKCLCGPKFPYTAPASMASDCNDGSATQNPAMVELCSTNYDDNCNGSTNENNAADCTTYYYDYDNDTWGQSSNSQCRCGPSGYYRATRTHDCNDYNNTIYPGRAEVCDGVDQNCVNGADDGGDNLCWNPTNATGRCGGSSGCYLSCSTDYYDIDGSYSNGCEVAQDYYDSGGRTNDSCGGHYYTGAYYDSSATRRIYTANIVPSGESDWYRAYMDDNGTGGKDFNFDIRFTSNPGTRYKFRVMHNTCSSWNLCSSSWRTHLRRRSDYNGTPTGTGNQNCTGSGGNGACGTSSQNCCHVATGLEGNYYIQVYRVVGGASPLGEYYSLQISNGYY